MQNILKVTLFNLPSHCISSVQFSSVTQSCPTLCDSMIAACQVSVSITDSQSSPNSCHRVRNAIQPSHLLWSPSPPAPNPSQHQGLFQWVNSSHEVVKVLVKWALESFTMSKASGGDETPVELFQMLKDDAVKVLYSICQQIWKTQQWQQDWKRSVFIVSGLEI